MPALNKTSILIFLVLALALVLAASLLYLNQKRLAYKKILGEKEALLVIDFGDGKERWFKGEVVEGMSVSDAFGATPLAKNPDFDFATDPRWRCYLNAKEIKDDFDGQTIYPKDKISCAYR